MLFNSFIFILGFLPVTLAGFYLALNRLGQRAAFGWLILASLVFYAWWNPLYVLLLLLLMLANYGCAWIITRRHSRVWLVLGIGLNICVLAYFKYTDFFIGTVNQAVGTDFPLLHIMLPLAISFFTFQKIAFLVDCYRGVARAEGLRDYMLFVSFFPQLIAGPIVHYQELMPQFKAHGYCGADARMMAIGLSLFAIGLFKKAVLADSAAIPADMVYGTAEAGLGLSFSDAWGGAVAYALQIYFDFSGYSDMAIGLALLFGVRLPDNFLSPYKATGIIDFWRRWHITLSRFLRDYLYIPLGGNRAGPLRQGFNVVITMLLGGLWHGASWNFVLWGGLHGVAIAVNHGLRSVGRRMALPVLMQAPWRVLCIVATFMLVTVLWVFFRAGTLHGAMAMLQALAGMGQAQDQPVLGSVKYFIMLTGMLALVWGLPNSMQIMFERQEGLCAWRPSWVWAGLIASLLLVGGMFMQSHLGKAFIYFDF